jgi:uncharacterized protein
MTRTIRRLAAADARRVPWKNGRGVTEELALWPPGASFERGDFDWRIARAAVEEDGPFSPFPGFDRLLIVTAGAGLRLDHGGRAPRARALPLRPHRFSGDWPTSATLLAGPVADLNVLARRGVVRTEAAVLRPGPRSLHVRELLESGHIFVHVLTGAVEARLAGDVPATWARDAVGGAAAGGEGGAVRLSEGESLWIGAAPADGGAARLLQLELGGTADEGDVLLLRLAEECAGG